MAPYKYRPKHQCSVAHASIEEYMQKYMPDGNDRAANKELLVYTIRQLNNISSLLMYLPDTRGKFNKKSFYTLKDLIVYFMFTISEPADLANVPEDRLLYTVKPRNIYTTAAGQKLYELTFNIDGEEINITTVDNPAVSYGYLPEFFGKDFTPATDLTNNPERDYTNATLFDLVTIYDEFLEFLMKNRLFFMMFFDIRYIEYILQNFIFKNTIYAVHRDPTVSISKMSFFSHYFFLYVYRYNREKGKIECAKAAGNQIQEVWSSAETQWIDFEKFAEENGVLSGNRCYTTGYDIYDRPMFLDMAKAVDSILNALHRRDEITYLYEIQLIKNENDK